MINSKLKRFLVEGEDSTLDLSKKSILFFRQFFPKMAIEIQNLEYTETDKVFKTIALELKTNYLPELKAANKGEIKKFSSSVVSNPKEYIVEFLNFLGNPKQQIKLETCIQMYDVIRDSLINSKYKTVMIKLIKTAKKIKDVVEETVINNETSNKTTSVYLGTSKDVVEIFENYGFNTPTCKTKLENFGISNIFCCENIEDAQKYADKFENGIILELNYDFGDVTYIKNQFKLETVILKEDITINEVKTSEVFYIVDQHGSKLSGPYSEEIKAHDKLKLLIKQAKKDKTDEEVENLKVQSFKEMFEKENKILNKFKPE